MNKVYLLAASILLAGLALSLPFYEAPRGEPVSITIGQDDEGRRQALYEKDAQEFGEEKARMMMRTRERSDSSLAFPQRYEPSR